MRVRGVVLVLSMVVSGCSAEVADPPSPTPASERSVADLPALLHRRVERHVAHAADVGLAPSWVGAKLGRVRPLARPGREGTSYYEVQVLDAEGGPAGFVVLSSGPHDAPIAHWNEHGPTPTDALGEDAGDGTTNRYVKLGHAYAAIDPDGELVATSLRAVDDAKLAWSSLERAALDEVATGTVETAASAQWTDLEAAESHLGTELRVGVTQRFVLLARPERWTVDAPVRATLVDDGGRTSLELVAAAPGAAVVQIAYADGTHEDVHVIAREGDAEARSPGAYSPYGELNCPLEETPNYDQLSPGMPGNSWGNWSGCGATAWTMLLGWIDRRAANGDAKWWPYRGIYRLGGMPSPFAVDYRAPDMPMWPDEGPVWPEAGPAAVMDLMRQDLGSFPWNGGTTTTVWGMANFGIYLQRVGINGSQLKVETNMIGGAPWDPLKGTVASYVCDAHQPAIIGFNDHYGVASHFYRDPWNNAWFWINMGHGGGDDGWYYPTPFYVASLVPLSAPVPPSSSNPGMEIVRATDYFGWQEGTWGNANAFLSQLCNGQTSCSVYLPVDWTSINRVFRAEWVCGNVSKRKLVTVGVHGATLSLTCP